MARSRSALRILPLSFFVFILLTPAATGADTPAQSDPDPLIQVLVSKGILTPEEGQTAAGEGGTEQRRRLVELLRQKGIISEQEASALCAPPASSQVAPNLVASTTPMAPSAAAVEPVKAEAKPEPPKFIPAIAPIRFCNLSPPVREV